MLTGYNFEVKYIKTSRICPVFRPLFHTLYGRLPGLQVLFFTIIYSPCLTLDVGQSTSVTTS